MKELEKFLDYEQPTKYIVSSDLYDDNYKTPVLTAGKSFILGYTNEENNIYDASIEPVILFDDFTTSIKYVDFPFKVKSSALKILHAKPGVNIKYVYYAMLGIHINSSVHKRYWISEFSHIKIKDCSLEQQNNIVNQLDMYMESINKYKNDSQQLEKFIISKFNEEFGSINSKYKLKEIAIMERGSSITKLQANAGDIPVVAGGQEPAYYHDQYNRTGETITVSGSGAYAGYVQYWNRPIFCSDCFSIKSKDENVITTKFLYYYLKSKQTEIYLTKRGAGIPHVTISSIEGFEIPIPTIQQQKKFNDLLSLKDEIITLINDNINYLYELFNIKSIEFFE